MNSVTFKCPAKINLFLKVTGKTIDGYHELESLFAFLDLYDILTIKKSSHFNIKIDGEFAANISPQHIIFNDIIKYFRQKFSISENIEISLTKNIPVGAGLGGGSSDAAYFMKGLNQLFSLNLSNTDLQKISLNFGSDIAFLLQNEASIVRGRGEKIINYKKFKPISALLINPNISLSTKEVFSAFCKNFSHKLNDEVILNHEIYKLLELENDLEEPAIKALPVIKEIIDFLKNNQAKIVKMSGSGASCFAIFDDEIKERNTLSLIKKTYPQFFAKQVNILPNV